jgi:uncharacterized protein (DUF885 family)
VSSINTFQTAYFDHFTRDPNMCLELGVDGRGGELPDRSPTETDATLAEARELLGQVDALLAQSPGFDEALDLDMARLSLEREVFDLTYTFNGATQRAQCPRGGDDLGIGLTILLSNDPRPSAERLADVAGRLEQIPAYLEGVLATVSQPVARWVDMDLATVAELPSLFETLQNWATETSFEDLPRIVAARGRAEAALTSYAQRLAALPTTTALHIGLESTRQLVKLRGIDRSLEDLHKMATDFLAETSATLDELRGRLVERHGLPADTSVDALQQHLAKTFRVSLPTGKLEDILDRYQVERGRLDTFIRERDLFPLDLDENISIERTPAYLTPTIPAGAMWPPAPFREGTKTSLVHLTLSDELVDEHTELSIPGMMLHEGTPGHHLQLAWASLHPSIVRRIYSGNEHHEGWTTYLEDYMLDQGYMGELVDEARFVGKRDISRIGARVAIDLFFMSGEKRFLDVGIDADITPDDPFEAAGNLLAAVTGFVPGRVQAELNWYSVERGYPLSYLTGNRMLWDLKRDVIAADQRRHEGIELDRSFHEVFLKAGNMPMAYMRRVMEHEGLLG